MKQQVVPEVTTTFRDFFLKKKERFHRAPDIPLPVRVRGVAVFKRKEHFDFV